MKAFQHDLIPSANEGLDVGTSTHRFRTIRCQRLEADTLHSPALALALDAALADHDLPASLRGVLFALRSTLE